MARLAPLLLVAFVLLCAPARAATLTTSIETTKLEVGDSVTLVISLTGGDSAQPPDLSGLSKDFDILDRRRGSRPATVDGKRSVVNDWVLTLSPKRAGTLTIPAFTLAGASTQPIRVEVTAPVKPAKEETRSIFVEVDVPKGAVYAQSEVPVYVRVYDSLGMRSGSISQIRAEGASFREDGQQDSFTRTIGKTRYQVVEQSYIMTPQRSGKIEIEPVTLSANIPMLYGSSASQTLNRYGNTNSPAPWLDGSLMRGQDINLHSEKVTVDVLPRPAAAQGWFLPARAVTVQQTWSADPTKARVGETLTRTITIEAVGASPNQLPPVTPQEVDGLRQYEEDSKTQTATIDREPGAILNKVVAVVPTRAGTFTLPEITIGWWNTDRKVQEQAILPAVTLTVAAAPGATVPTPPPGAAEQASSPTPSAPETPPEPQAPTSGLTAAVSAAVAMLVDLWEQARSGGGTWLAALVGGLAILAAIAVAPRLLRRARGKGGRLSAFPAMPRFTPAAPANRQESERALARAARANDAAGAYAAYLALVRPEIVGRGLADPKPRTPALETAVKDLRTCLYGAPGTAWDGKGFLSAWRMETRAAARKPGRAQQTLRPLYPEA